MSNTGTLNVYSKTRKINHPYLVIVDGDWEYRVLKAYQTPANEAKNPFARWLCAVKSPYTFGSYDMGDTYIRDIPRGGLEMECICDDPSKPDPNCPMNELYEW